MALIICQELTQDHITTHGHPKPVALFLYNQEALPKRNSASQHPQPKLYTNLQKWVEHFPVRLYWCPGHVGIPENKIVDTLAKDAAESQNVSPYTINTISLSKLKQHTIMTLTNNPPHQKRLPKLASRPHPNSSPRN
ncbi:hypothetical protein O181_032704 [Austropuccinia psidii MF-1]|uniref:RNase H type-1 domain-containing protein n=1 Tax=Austropuccinia psidii MF-1 TaxID=1389203 RepID=A0A9Q3CXB4_9BASI|nr:hypothetical protein [Austropuccinia psidii MF-1]